MVSIDSRRPSSPDNARKIPAWSTNVSQPEKVRQLSAALTRQMRATGHPFILGSECDILSVPGSEQTIKAKVEAFLPAA
jgi:hypothetical protein